eukprot:scaffold62448_cov36-Tisochrysis_lutea.AAC.3
MVLAVSEKVQWHHGATKSCRRVERERLDCERAEQRRCLWANTWAEPSDKINDTHAAISREGSNRRCRKGLCRTDVHNLHRQERPMCNPHRMHRE